MMLPDKEFYICPSCLKLIVHMLYPPKNLTDSRLWTDGKGYAPMMPNQPQIVKCGNCDALLWFDELKRADYVFLREAHKYNVPSPHSLLPLLKSSLIPYNKKKEKYIRIKVWWAENDARRQDKFPYLSEKSYTLEELLEAKNKVSESKVIPLSVEKATNSSIITKLLKFIKGRFFNVKHLPIDKDTRDYILRKRMEEHEKDRKSKDIPLTKEETANLHALALLLDESNENDRIMKAEIMRELCMYEEAMELLKKPFNENLLPFADKIKSLTAEKKSFVREIMLLVF